MLNWVTRGYFLGTQRNYFEIHVDDIFLPDDRWSTTENKTAIEVDATRPAPRVGPDEYECTRDPTVTDPAGVPAADPHAPGRRDRAIAWQTANGLVMDMVYNGVRQR